MKHTKKLNLLLRGLYEYRFDSIFHGIEGILNQMKVPFEGNESYFLAERLYKDGYIEMSRAKDGTSGYINSYGVEYCEKESYSNINTPVISIVNINSPNSNISTGNYNSQHIVLKNEGIVDDIKVLQKQIESDREIRREMVKEIGLCLDELSDLVSNKKPISKIYLKGFISVIADIATIYPLAEKLVQSLKGLA